jgi:hypothetical protein
MTPTVSLLIPSTVLRSLETGLFNMPLGAIASTTSAVDGQTIHAITITT